MTAVPDSAAVHDFARRLDFTTLQLFVAVGETGSIGRAAAREVLAASAVSKRLSELEALAGVPLLLRHARGVALTPAGQSLLRHAQEALFELKKMQAALGEYASGARGPVRVHASISAVVQFLPDDLGRFVRENADVKIELQEHLQILSPFFFLQSRFFKQLEAFLFQLGGDFDHIGVVRTGAHQVEHILRTGEVQR